MPIIFTSRNFVPMKWNEFTVYENIFIQLTGLNWWISNYIQQKFVDCPTHKWFLNDFTVQKYFFSFNSQVWWSISVSCLSPQMPAWEASSPSADNRSGGRSRIPSCRNALVIGTDYAIVGPCARFGTIPGNGLTRGKSYTFLCYIPTEIN